MAFNWNLRRDEEEGGGEGGGASGGWGHRKKSFFVGEVHVIMVLGLYVHNV